MSLITNLVVVLGLTLVVGATPVPSSDGGEEKPPATLHAYSESNDTDSTFEEIMEEIAASKRGESEAEKEQEHTISKR